MFLFNFQIIKLFIFDFCRKDRYNLAKIEYLPFLLHNSNPGTSTITWNPTFVPSFQVEGNVVGGEVDGYEELRPGEYTVKRDINIRPGGKLSLHSGVRLFFPPAVGMMVAGKLDAKGNGPSKILLTLKEEIVMEPIEAGNETETVDEEVAPKGPEVPVRLVGGKTSNEGRLQVRFIILLFDYVAMKESNLNK